ncbi:UNVERIFIED_CONTAM: hypothetical protein K2H54_014985 [Gekko kuhli]
MNNSLQVNLPRSWASSSSSLQEKSEHSFFLFYYYRMEDEAVLDRGASFLKHVCDDEEVEVLSAERQLGKDKAAGNPYGEPDTKRGRQKWPSVGAGPTL